MEGDLMRAATALIERLATLAAQDDGLRGKLRAFAEAFLAVTERPSVASQEMDQVESSQAVQEARTTDEVLNIEGDGVAAKAVRRPPSPLPELTLGRSRPAEVSPAFPTIAAVVRTIATDADLPDIEARCRLKAEGIRWAATRHRLLEDGADFRVEVAPRDRKILDRARGLECYLWMNTPDFTIPRDPAVLETAAGCFEAVADAIALVRGLLPDFDANREFVESALDLLAEAQSSLRVAVDRIDGQRDQDQLQAYTWLRDVAAREQIYIRRNMRIDDPADPARLHALEARIEALDSRLQEVRQRTKNRKSHLSRLRYHAKVIGQGNGTEHDWQKVVGTISAMLDEGTPASNVEIRETLLPILDLMPDLDDASPEFRLVLREIDLYLASRMTSLETPAEQAPSPEVAEVTRLLAGSTVVLIGGIRRPESHEALKSAFQLDELVWIETREHASIDKFEPYVARPEVGLVLLAIRWSSHSFGEVKRFCDRYGKPMVRLPGGYNPNQVAAQILAQSSGQLEPE